jgi:WD40 repeat protein
VRPAAPLVKTHGRRQSFDDPVIGLAWLKDTLVTALADGSIHFETAAGRVNKRLHKAALSICPHPDGQSVLSGGDEGRVMKTDLSGATIEMGSFGNKWVHALISNAASGVVIAAAGREVVVWPSGASRPSHSFDFDSSIGGVSLDAKGKRLAVSHYNGVTLLYPLMPASPRVRLDWRGSHLSCALAPDNGYVVTAMQETGLHGWQLPSKTQFGMSGYEVKTRSFSWSHKGRWLATSGGTGVILWPFTGKTGPLNREPVIVGERPRTRVTQVAFHPRTDHLAVGYSDGAVTLIRLEDGSALAIDDPADSISALRWRDDGTALAYAGEDGRVGILDMGVRA